MKNTNEDITEQRTCEQHGSYVAKRGRADIEQLLGREIWSGCRACDREAAARQEAEWQREALRLEAERRVAAASIPLRFQGKVLDNFVAATPEQQSQLKICSEYVTNFDEHRAAGRCLVMIGPVGTGKTHLACGIVDALVQAKYNARYATVAAVIRDIRATWDRETPGSEKSVLERFAKYDLLVLDEAGLQRGTESERVHLEQLIGMRYDAVRPTVVVSNCTVEELAREYIGERAVDRLRENGGILITFSGESHRHTVPAEIASTERATTAVVQ